MLVHNAVADAQSQTGSLTHFFRSEEGIKNAIRMRDSRPIVEKRNLNRVALARGRNFDSRRAANFTDRVVRIVQDIQENLLQLV